MGFNTLSTLENGYKIKTMKVGELLNYDDWYERNEEEINIELAETGADRELDFDSEKEFDDRYSKYVETYMEHYGRD